MGHLCKLAIAIISLTSLCGVSTNALAQEKLFLGQGIMSGEPTETSILIQTRLTSTDDIDASGDVPGSQGWVQFQWSESKEFVDSNASIPLEAIAANDFIVRHFVKDLKPDTHYHVRVRFGKTQATMDQQTTGTFRTLPGKRGDRRVKIIVASCMNYMKFMHGKEARASGPVTATEEDRRLGYRAFQSMQQHDADFFVGTGDIVYYDNPYRTAKTVEELRKVWHEQFRFRRMRDFFKKTPAYWSKDDHDFRYNDADLTKPRLPLPQTGIDRFTEQLPIAPQFASNPKTYRTHRVNQHLQIWLTEGRDFRSDNRSPDEAGKTLWGNEQREWLKKTIKASDAKWKLIITPTPMVGPDDGYKKDNHANLKGFQHEAQTFFRWLQDENIEGLMTVCGDRHWQYHSIHPMGIEEFACGALNDENSRLGVKPGSKKGTDPEAKIKQPFMTTEKTGGYLVIEADQSLTITYYDDEGQQRYQVKK